MKRLVKLIIICILFTPLLVNAETCDNDKITISSITIDNKSDSVNETNEATVKDKNINLNLNMSNVGDNIKYKINIKNDSNEDYILDKNSVNVSSDYVDYIIELDDNSNIIKAKTSKNIFLRVSYNNPVPENVFENGIFNDNINMKVNLSTGVLENPNTGVEYITFIIFVVLLLVIVLILFIKKRLLKTIFLLISLSIIIPISVNALCSCDISINSTIKINKPIECGSFESDSWDVISHNIKNGNDDCYNIGDTKEVELEGFGTHTVRVANKSTPDECNQEGFSQTACGFVVEFNDSVAGYYMKEDSSNRGGWEACDMRVFVNNDILNSLPNDLKNNITDTLVVSGHGYSDQNNFITLDKLYLLSAREIWGEIDNTTDTAYDATRQLDYYSIKGVTISNYDNAIKYNGTTKLRWWLRSTTRRLSDHFDMNNTGFMYGYYAGAPHDVSPAFRIG